MNTFMTIKQYPKSQKQIKSFKHNHLKMYHMVTRINDNNQIIITMI